METVELFTIGLAGIYWIADGSQPKPPYVDNWDDVDNIILDNGFNLLLDDGGALLLDN